MAMTNAERKRLDAERQRLEYQRKAQQQGRTVRAYANKALRDGHEKVKVHKIKAYKNKTELRDGVLGKVCFKCGAFKAVTEFTKDPRLNSGFCGSCNECRAKDDKQNHLKYYTQHTERVKKVCLDYARHNKEKIATKHRHERENLAPQYIEKLLKLPKRLITPELVDLQTQSLQIKRLRKEISTALKESKS